MVTTHTRLRAHGHCTSSTLIGGKTVEPIQVRFTLHLMDQRSKWTQDGCKVCIDSYMSSNGSFFMVTWMIFKNHLLEVGLTQNHETIAFWNLKTIDLFYFRMCENPMWIKIHGNSICLRARDHSTWFWKCLGTAFGHFLFGFSQFHGHGSWLVCEAALTASLCVIGAQTLAEIGMLVSFFHFRDTRGYITSE